MQKSSPNGVRWMLRCTVLAATDAAHRLQHLGLGLEHLVGDGVADRLAREPDQPQPLEVVEVGGHAVAVLAPGLRADHVHAAGDELGARPR